MVTVKLLAVLENYALKDGCVELDFKPGMTVADVLDATDVTKTDIEYTVFVNNTRKKLDDIIADNDIIMVIPLLIGG